VIKPIRPGKLELNRLLDGITAENLHSGVDFGGPVGRESL
jgi:antitoxin component of MazEF toxin-antitoxin module